MEFSLLKHLVHILRVVRRFYGTLLLAQKPKLIHVEIVLKVYVPDMDEKISLFIYLITRSLFFYITIITYT